jgi:hypothetical protein
MKIPETVTRTLDLNAATAALELARVREQLDTLTVSSALGRRLRVRREQLARQLDAWEHLASVARSKENQE